MVEMQKEVRKYFIEHAKHMAWVSLMYQVGLLLVSNFAVKYPLLFWSISGTQLACVICQSWICIQFKYFQGGKEKIWDWLFYSTRIAIYLLMSLLTCMVFYEYENSWATLLAVGIFCGSLEMIVGTFHPHVRFGLLCLVAAGVVPSMGISIILYNKGQSMMMPMIGNGYILISIVKMYSLHKRFVQTVKIRFENFKNQIRLQKFLDAMPAKVTCIDEDLNYLEINQTMVDAYGRSKTDYVGKKVGFQDTTGTSALVKVLKSFRETTADSIALEAPLLFKGTEEREHSIHIKRIPTIYDGTSGKSEFIIVAVDISEQRRIQAELEEERIKNVQSARLSAVGEMAAGIAHEIKNPLAIIQGSLSILQREIKTGKISLDSLGPRLMKMSETVMRIASIITSMQRLSRDSSVDQHIWTSVPAVIDDVKTLCTERFKLAQINLDISKIPEDIEMFCQPQQIGQVILNLLNNAYDVLVLQDQREIRVQFEQNGNSGLRILISDNGPGVKNPTRLFHPFYTTKDPGKGTGLGLSLSKKIMDQHRSNITYERRNERSYFILEFPASHLRKNFKVA